VGKKEMTKKKSTKAAESPAPAQPVKKNRLGAERSAQLYRWVAKYGRKPVSQRTSEMLARIAGKELGFSITANRMARELYRQGIDFRKTDMDPNPPKFSKVELLRAQVEFLKKRLEVLEGKVLGKVVKEEPSKGKPLASGNKGTVVHKTAKPSKPTPGNTKTLKKKPVAVTPKKKNETKPDIKPQEGHVVDNTPSVPKEFENVTLTAGAGADHIDTPVEEPSITAPRLSPLGETGENS
jgi:hypothetical protein